MKGFGKRVAVFFGFALLLAVAWMARQVLLLLFVGLLVAVIFTSAVNWLRRFVSWPRKALLAIVIVAMLGLAALGIALIAPRISEQFAELAETLPRELERLSADIQEWPVFKSVSGIVPDPERLLPSPRNIGDTASSFLVGTFDALSGIVLVFFLGIFLAANPELYRRGFLKLIPREARTRADEVIDRCVCTIKDWLLGQGLAMIGVGIITGVSLGIAGIPLAAALGVVAAVLEFIPFIGPIISAAPAVLLAAGMGGAKVLIVIAIFVGVQFLEGNVLQPLVQQKAVDLPPVITLLAIVVFGTAFGLLGMLIATPLAAVIVVLVQELYVRDALGDASATER